MVVKRKAAEPAPDDDSTSSSDLDQELLVAPTKPDARSSSLFAELENEEDEVCAIPDEPEVPEDDLAKDEAIRTRLHHSQTQMKNLFQHFTEEQKKRFEMFRQHSFPKAGVRKLMQRVLEQVQVNHNVVIVVAGIAKVYVGELVEEARRVMEEKGEVGPIPPIHMLEAQRRLKAARLVPSSPFHRPRNRLL